MQLYMNLNQRIAMLSLKQNTTEIISDDTVEVVEADIMGTTC